MRKVLFISLGCDKNLADSEDMLGMLVEKGYEITNEEKEAEVIVSIPAPLSMMQKRKVLTVYWRWPSIKKPAG